MMNEQELRKLVALMREDQMAWASSQPDDLITYLQKTLQYYANAGGDKCSRQIIALGIATWETFQRSQAIPPLV